MTTFPRAVAAVLIAILLALVANVPAAPAATRAAPPHTELSVVPLVGGDTDNGIGVGELSSVGRLAPDAEPYVWRLESGGFISFKSREEAGKRSIISPYQDVYALLTVPRVFTERLHLDLRPSFTRETTQRYYGVGNASVAPPDDVPSRDDYTRGHPTLSLRLRFRFVERIFWELGGSYTENWFTIDKRFIIASALFGDVGCLWATLPTQHPELDGTGLGLKYGLGGGLRVQGGETFVVRLDVAWSPDARPVGVYLMAGQEF